MDDVFRYDPAVTGVKGLVYVGNKILIYRRDNNTRQYPLLLDLPGGGSENHETPFETFQREVMEVFDLPIKPAEIMYGKPYPSATRPGTVSYFLVAKLPADAATDIVFGTEGLEYCLLTPEDYLSRTDAWDVLQQRSADYIASTNRQ